MKSTLILAATFMLLSFDSVSACWCQQEIEDTEANYADRVRGELVASKCSRTRPANEAERDLNELDRSGARGQERPCPVDVPCGGIPRFAEYGNIRASDERAVLDHLARQLVSSPDEIAYVLIYAGQEACTNEARLRLVRIKNYLVKKHAIASDRIVLKDGGFRADLSTQLGFCPHEPKISRKRLPTYLVRTNFLEGANLKR